MDLSSLTADHIDKTSLELDVWVKENPTGDIVSQKKLRRLIQSKDRDEKQAQADSFLNLKDHPKSEAGFGSDVFGEFVKIYLNGKTRFDDDGVIDNGR